MSLAAGLGLAASASAAEYDLYIGTYTNTLSRGIYHARLDAVTGKLSTPELAVEVASPCFLALSPDARWLYTANEGAGMVGAYARAATNGSLQALNTAGSSSTGPCHVSVSPDGKFLFAANYGSGSVKSFRLGPTGAVAAEASLIQHHGSGPNHNRQASAHAHFACTDASGKFLLVCDLGLDAVKIYTVQADGTLTEHGSASVPPGAGARHLVFSQDQRYVYVANEMGCSVSQFAWDAAAGRLKAMGTVSALAPGEKPNANWTAAEILLHPSGKFVYVTIRGEDTVTVLQAEPKSGHLKFVQTIPAGGKFPRGLGIDPSGRWLFTGNQRSDQVVEFAIDPATGKLTATGESWTIGSPVDFKFAPVK